MFVLQGFWVCLIFLLSVTSHATPSGTVVQMEESML